MTSEREDVDVGSAVVNGLGSSSNGQERDLDPAKVCAGKGAVTLRASLTYEENPSASPTCPQVAQQSESDWRLSPNIDSNGDALPSALASKGYRSVRPNIPSETKPQDATCSATAPAQTKVIVVPLHQVHPDRGQEAGSGTPPPPLVPFGQSSACPEASSAGSHLTFPTLDDFIPPHLQKGPHHNQPPAVSGTVPHLRPKLPSLSPPPSLVPPTTEGSNRVSEPESMGVTVRTVSPAARCPGSFAKFNVPNMTFLTGVLNFEQEAPGSSMATGTLFTSCYIACNVSLARACARASALWTLPVVCQAYSLFLSSVLFGDLLTVISYSLS